MSTGLRCRPAISGQSSEADSSLSSLLSPFPTPIFLRPIFLSFQMWLDSGARIGEFFLGVDQLEGRPGGNLHKSRQA